MVDRALMQMASNALKNCRLLIYKWSDFAHDSLKKKEELASDIASLSLAIQSLDDRLAQPEPEAVDWEAVAADQAMTIAMMTLEPKRKWVSLTDEEIKEVIGPWGETPVKGYTRKLFDAIEAKLKQKNN